MNSRRTILALLLAIVAITATARRADARGCLAAGTMVLTPNGSTAVENLKVGDAIWSINQTGIHRAMVVGTTEVTVDAMLVIHAGDSVLHVTPEHPLQTATGTYTEAGKLAVGDRLWVWDRNVLAAVTISSIQTSPIRQHAYNLMVSPGGTYIAGGFAVHNKGCFLPDTPILKSDGTQTAIGDIRSGDRLKAFTPDGIVVETTVESVISIEVDEYYRVTTEAIELDVTAEHPFFVGNGTFKTLEALSVGDTIYAVADGKLQPQKIRTIERIAKRTTVYNLQTDDPHTFFACGIAVHNKGCFPAGTMIQTPDGTKAIELIRRGDRILSVNKDGRVVRQSVIAVFQMRASLFTLHTAMGDLTTTRDHPLAVGCNEFRPAGELGKGDTLLRYEGGRLVSAQIMGMAEDSVDAPVFNLEVDGPHTFIADGFVVHNKGGGGGGGHGGGGFGGGGFGGGGYGGHYYYSGGHYYYSNGNNNNSWWGCWDIMFLIIVICVIANGLKSFNTSSYSSPYAHIAGGSARTLFGRDRADEDLDFVHTRAAVLPKTQQTTKLLLDLASRDPSVQPAMLTQRVRSTFTLLQQSWQARDYEPMRPLLMADLFAAHVTQLAAMVRQHEIDHIDDLEIRFIDLVHVRYTARPEQREFTALITALARDYYTDDRNGKFIRGDRTQTIFQEFWTFHCVGGEWRLREIEQSRESNALMQENYVEGMSSAQLEQVAGPPGRPVRAPGADAATTERATRVNTIMQNLRERDPIWDRLKMMSRARDLFLQVYLCQEAGDISHAIVDDFVPATLAQLKSELEARKLAGESVEYRNLCVRNVEVVFVRGNVDKSRWEYMARLVAHAQTTTMVNSTVTQHDDYEMPFVKYLSFACLDGVWKLKALLPEATGIRMVANAD